MVKITDILRKYREKTAIVEVALARIQSYNDLIKSGDYTLLALHQNNSEIGMPKSRNYNSTIETEVIMQEKEVEITKEILLQLIAGEKSKIYPLQIELEQINMAFDSLSKQEMSILEWKYMDNLEWRNVEISYFEQYKINLTEETLRKKAQTSINTLHRILRNFYDCKLHTEILPKFYR